METSQSGCLLVVATPIGNLSDLSDRARDALREADLVVAEDTRRTGQLLAHEGIERPLLSCHRFNEAGRIEELIARLRAGETLALVTDGGTPAIADPGYRLVAAAHEAGCRVEARPGASAVVAALSVAGLPADRFSFAGFLPSKGSARRRRLEELAAQRETLVLYEAPHRLLDALTDMAAMDGTLGARQTVLCRELTKMHEEVVRGTPAELRARLAERAAIKGEIVLVVGPDEKAPGRGAVDGAPEELEELYEAALAAEEGDPKRALRRLARDLDAPRAKVKGWLAARGG